MKCEAVAPWGSRCVRSPHSESVSELGPTHLDRDGETWRAHVGPPQLHVVGRPEPDWVSAQAAALTGER